MNCSELIKQTPMEGVILEIFPKGTINASDSRSAVDKCLPAIGNNNVDLLCELQHESKRKKVLALFEGKRFSLFVSDDTTDPVIAALEAVHFRAGNIMTFLQGQGAAGSL